MDKTLEKNTKDPKSQEQSKKSHETYMNRLKEKLIRDNQLSTSSSMDRPTLSTSSSTDRFTPSTSYSTDNSTPSTFSSTARSSDNYVYGVGILALLAIGVCAIKNKSMKKNSNHQNDVICFISDESI